MCAQPEEGRFGPQAGGVLQERDVSSLEELASDCDLLVNCSGLGAAKLFGDTQIYPVRYYHRLPVTLWKCTTCKGPPHFIGYFCLLALCLSR
jgi:hypothetical protein